MLCCRLIFKTPGDGHLIQLRGTLLVVLIVCSHQGRTLLIWSLWIYYGGRMSLWRSPCSLDGFFGTGCPLRQTWSREALSLLRLNCVSSCGQQESEIQLFLSFPLFGTLWKLVRYWPDIYSTDSFNIVDHFYQFGRSFGFGKSWCIIFYLIWFACPWVIWKERNDRLFCNKENSPIQLLRMLNFYPSEV